MISKIMFFSTVLTLSHAGTLVGEGSVSQLCYVSARSARRLGNSQGRPAKRRPLKGPVDYNSETSESESPDDGDAAEVYSAPPRSPTESSPSYTYFLPPLEDRIRNAIVETCTETFGLCDDLAGMISDFTGVPDVNPRRLAGHHRGAIYDYYQIYKIDTKTWKGTHHHGKNVYFDTYDGAVEIRITEPDSRRDLAVYRITDQATFMFDGGGYGYSDDDISYRVEGLLDDKGSPAVLDITISRIASGIYGRKIDLKRMLRRYNIRRIDTEGASDSSSSDSSHR